MVDDPNNKYDKVSDSSNTDRQRGDNILDLGIALLYSLINYCFTKESEHINL